MTRTGLAAIIVATFLASPAFAAGIEGNWRTESGADAQISKCGGSYCIKLTSGNFAGRQIGKMRLKGDKYVGSITDPTNDKTYKGDARVSGSTMKLRGCVLFCSPATSKQQTWTKK